MMGTTSLPNEILFEIFGYLDYWTLKLNVAAVCKHFRYLLTSDLGVDDAHKTIFRDKPLGELGFSWEYDTHPALELLCFNLSGSIEDVTFKGPNRITFSNHPITTENATTPAVSQLSISFHTFPGLMLGTSKVVYIRNHSDQPVTVHDVIAAMVRQMKTDLDNAEYKWYVSWLYGAHEDEWITGGGGEGRGRRNLASMMDFDGCERYWDGVRGIKIVKGEVRLMAREFKVVEKEARG